MLWLVSFGICFSAFLFFLKERIFMYLNAMLYRHKLKQKFIKKDITATEYLNIASNYKKIFKNEKSIKKIVKQEDMMKHKYPERFL